MVWAGTLMLSMRSPMVFPMSHTIGPADAIHNQLVFDLAARFLIEHN